MSAAAGYERARDLAANADPRVRAELAAGQDVAPEILYFLTGDREAVVRRAVAANPRTPAQGNLVLADDGDAEVRRLLAEKITHAQSASARDRTLTGQALDRLARDRVAQVRAVIAEALKTYADADAAMIGRLARDAEILVAAPVLEYSPLLTDGDLLEVIGSHPVQEALTAITRRAYVSEEVTRAIVGSGNVTAIACMLENSNAQLQESTLDALVEGLASQPGWQPPLIFSPDQTGQQSLRLAQAVATQLLERIVARRDLPPETLQAIAGVVRKRLEEQVASGPVAAAPVAGDIGAGYAPLLARAGQAREQGRLDENGLMVALLSDQADEVVAGLSVLSGVPVSAILQMVAAQSPRALCALAWTAGVSALFAAELQLRLGRIAVAAVIRPTAGGGYPLTEDEMRWQIDMYASLEGLG